MSAPLIVEKALDMAPGVTGLVGKRIYGGRASQGAPFPNIVVARTSEREPIDLSRAGGLREARVVVICRAERHIDAEELGEAVIAALAGYTSPEGAEIDRDAVDSTVGVDANGKALFMRTLGFVVWHGG